MRETERFVRSFYKKKTPEDCYPSLARFRFRFRFRFFDFSQKSSPFCREVFRYSLMKRMKRKEGEKKINITGKLQSRFFFSFYSHAWRNIFVETNIPAILFAKTIFALRNITSRYLQGGRGRKKSGSSFMKYETRRDETRRVRNNP